MSRINKPTGSLPPLVAVVVKHPQSKFKPRIKLKEIAMINTANNPEIMIAAVRLNNPSTNMTPEIISTQGIISDGK